VVQCILTGLSWTSRRFRGGRCKDGADKHKNRMGIGVQQDHVLVDGGWRGGSMRMEGVMPYRYSDGVCGKGMHVPIVLSSRWSNDWVWVESVSRIVGLSIKINP
jgi:hypothetical protein